MLGKENLSDTSLGTHFLAHISLHTVNSLLQSLKRIFEMDKQEKPTSSGLQETVDPGTCNYNKEDDGIGKEGMPNGVVDDKSVDTVELKNPYKKKRVIHKIENPYRQRTVPNPVKRPQVYRPEAAIVQCYHCSAEMRVGVNKRYYECRTPKCHNVMIDKFRDDVIRVTDIPNSVKQDRTFVGLEAMFKSIVCSFDDTKGPRANNVEGLWRMKHEAITSGLLPEDGYNPEWETNMEIHRYIRKVEDALCRKNQEDFKNAYYCLMHLLEAGLYRHVPK